MTGIISILSRQLPRSVQTVGLKAVRNHECSSVFSTSDCCGRSAAAATTVASCGTCNATLPRCNAVSQEYIFPLSSKSLIRSLTFSALGWQSFHTTSNLCSAQVVKVPPFADSITEGDIKFTCKVGDSFGADEAVMEIETDKTTMPVPAPFAGSVTEILVKDGDTVKPGQELFKMTPGAAPAKAAAAPAAAPAPPKPAAAPAAAAPKPAAAPAAAPAARAAPPPPPPPAARPPPAAPRAAAPPPAAVRPAVAQVKLPPVDGSRQILGTRSEQRVKMNRMRQKIAARLKDAQNTAAMLTTFNEIDMRLSLMSSAISYLTNHAFSSLATQWTSGNKIWMRLSRSTASSWASCQSLARLALTLCRISLLSTLLSMASPKPVLGSLSFKFKLYDDIVYRDYVDISVAVATPRGLVVPVIRNVESMNYADIEIALAGLADKAKRDAITVEDMDGGTFTISNGGVFGSLMGTPIINPPQSAILGMHGIFERPIAVKGEVKIRPMMYIALTYDHRIIDGREAVLFLRKVKAAVENPAIIVAGL
ncbi:hypothetical protein KR215_006835 [Drosophila sulfurigaster]|nr:hypothetical protein KR215_006835 [Drosophila sulfurigaster]